MKKHYIYLTYAGSLPFVFCAILLLLNINTIPILGNVELILSVYSLVIASFMAGSHWGQHLNISNKWRLYLPSFSNINAVILWISFLVFPFQILMYIFMLSFLLLWWIDKKLYNDNIIEKEYFYTRCFITFIVILSLIISGVYA